MEARGYQQQSKKHTGKTKYGDVLRSKAICLCKKCIHNMQRDEHIKFVLIVLS